MVGATTKICYDTFHMKVGMKGNHVVIFSSVIVLWLIVIHKSKDYEKQNYEKEKAFNTSHFLNGDAASASNGV